eukprot:Hpha_TRINITY_DN33897_c0_g1::TRINITY_DN33897_c0_g1_i1::g.27297::m.27297
MEAAGQEDDVSALSPSPTGVDARSQPPRIPTMDIGELPEDLCDMGAAKRIREWGKSLPLATRPGEPLAEPTEPEAKVARISIDDIARFMASSRCFAEEPSSVRRWGHKPVESSEAARGVKSQLPWTGVVATVDPVIDTPPPDRLQPARRRGHPQQNQASHTRTTASRTRQQLLDNKNSALDEAEHKECLRAEEAGQPLPAELQRFVALEQRSWRGFEAQRCINDISKVTSKVRKHPMNQSWLLAQTEALAVRVLEASYLSRIRGLPPGQVAVGKNGGVLLFVRDGAPFDHGGMESVRHAYLAAARPQHLKRLAHLGDVPAVQRCSVRPPHQIDPTDTLFRAAVLRGSPPTADEKDSLTGLKPTSLTFPGADGPPLAPTRRDSKAARARAVARGQTREDGRGIEFRRAGAAPVVSADRVAQHLAETEGCDAVITPSALAALAAPVSRGVAPQMRGDRKVLVPVTAVETKPNKFIFYIDRPLPLEKWTARRANTAVFKARVLADSVTSLAAAAYPRTLGTTVADEGEEWSPVEDEKVTSVSPCDDPEAFENWAYDVVQLGQFRLLCRSRTHGLESGTNPVVMRVHMEYNTKPDTRMLTTPDDERCHNIEAPTATERIRVWAALAARPPNTRCLVARVSAFTSSVLAWDEFGSLEEAEEALAIAAYTDQMNPAGAVAAVLELLRVQVTEAGRYSLLWDPNDHLFQLAGEPLEQADRHEGEIFPRAKPMLDSIQDPEKLANDLGTIDQTDAWREFCPAGFWRLPHQLPQTYPIENRFNSKRLSADADDDEYKNASRWYERDSAGRVTEYDA